MSKVKFNADEMMVMAMFEQPTRTETMRYIEEVVPFVEDDVEVFSLVASTMKKMRSIINGRESVLDKLRIRQMAREKQKSSQEQSADMERNRK